MATTFFGPRNISFHQLFRSVLSLRPLRGGDGKMARTVAGREPLQTHQPSPAEARISSLVRIQDDLVGVEREYQRAISAMGRATLRAFLGIVMTEPRQARSAQVRERQQSALGRRLMRAAHVPMCVCEIKYIYPAASSPSGLWHL